MASIYGFTLKNIKTFRGREGEGTQGSVYYQGKRVGWYNDGANGGCADIDFYAAGERRQECERTLRQAVEKYCTSSKHEYPPDEDIFFIELCMLIDTEKRYRKALGKGYTAMVVIELGGTNARIVSAPTKEKLMEYIEKEKPKTFEIYLGLEDFIIE